MSLRCYKGLILRLVVQKKILVQLLVPKIFSTKKCFEILGPTILPKANFAMQSFIFKKILSPKHFWYEIFLGPNNCLHKEIFGQENFWPQNIGPINFLGANIFLVLNNWVENIRSKEIKGLKSFGFKQIWACKNSVLKKL